MILAAIYEPVFSQHSHGFRAGRSCHTALEEIRNTWTGVKWLIEVDVRGFFDNIDHDVLLGLLARRIDDPVFIDLIGTMLKAGCMDEWKFERTYSGTPQGGVLSPLLATVYLHRIDRAWNVRQHGVLVRYADDVVVMCASRAQAEAALARLTALLAELGLEPKAAKTRIVPRRV